MKEAPDGDTLHCTTAMDPTQNDQDGLQGEFVLHFRGTRSVSLPPSHPPRSSWASQVSLSVLPLSSAALSLAVPPLTLAASREPLSGSQRV